MLVLVGGEIRWQEVGVDRKGSDSGTECWTIGRIGMRSLVRPEQGQTKVWRQILIEQTIVQVHERNTVSEFESRTLALEWVRRT